MVKQAIVVRMDIKMGKGKMCAQVAHASLSAYKEALRKNKKIAEEWEREGMKKIVLKAKNLNELLEYYEKCKEMGVPVSLIKDAGHTQVEPGTITCFGAGPWKEEEIDALLGHLKLL
ncbi:MAG: peptidyl-tRNA hydrolase Pth2 [Candidatus Anstonellales archaeon]